MGTRLCSLVEHGRLYLYLYVNNVISKLLGREPFGSGD